MKYLLAITSILLAFTIYACGPKSAEYGVKGAAGGAVSASFVGAMTDLIVDGEVNTYRLTRNAVGGAVAGGTAGAIVGHQQDKADTAQDKAAEQAVASGATATDAEVAALKKKIGPDNVNGLKQLVQCNHEAAYRSGMTAARSDNPDFKEAGLVVQALVDRDRGNMEGANRVLPEIVEMNDKLADLTAAQKGLEDLHQMVVDERKINGAKPACQ